MSYFPSEKSGHVTYKLYYNSICNTACLIYDTALTPRVVSWRLKSPALRMFSCLFGMIKKKPSRLRITDPLGGKSTIGNWIPSQRARIRESVFISWRDHDPYPEPVYTGWSSVHWNATGMPLVDPVYTGIPLGDPANTCRVHWNTTGKT